MNICSWKLSFHVNVELQAMMFAGFRDINRVFLGSTAGGIEEGA